MVRIGLLGGGFIGQMHALAFSNASMSAWQPKIDVKMKVLAERDPDAGQVVQARYGFERLSSDWKEAATSSDVDIFVNAGPNHLHAAPASLQPKPGNRCSAKSRWRVQRTRLTAFGKL